MQTVIFYLGLYLVALLLNRYLNKIVHTKFNHQIDFRVWFVPFIPSMIYLGMISSYYLGKSQLRKSFVKWWTGKNWNTIEGYEKAYYISDLIQNRSYIFVVDSNESHSFVGEARRGYLEGISIYKAGESTKISEDLLNRITHYKKL